MRTHCMRPYTVNCIRQQKDTPDFEMKSGVKFKLLSFMWCHQESNRGHKDFQSFALPTELWHHCLIVGTKVDRNSHTHKCEAKKK